MAKIDDSVKKKVPELRFKGFTDEWEQRKLGDEVRIVMGQSPNSENYTDDPNGRYKCEDLFCISQTKNPKEMVYDYDHETK